MTEYLNADVSLRDQLSSTYSLSVGIASLILSVIGLLWQRRRPPTTSAGGDFPPNGGVARDASPDNASFGEGASTSKSLSITPFPAGAQPIYVNMMVITILMKERCVHRRITERLITAYSDNVAGYRISASSFTPKGASRLSFRSLWGCSIESIRDLRAVDTSGEVLLRFPRPLRAGEKHYFSSETVNHHTALLDHYYVNVEIDHLGIAAGELSDGHLPVNGLTVRIRFEDRDVPAACWWYDDRTSRDGSLPRAGDPHMLTISGGAVSHTFTQECQPHGNYGIAFRWGK
ncbi:hypothetical protein [Kribbella sp. ALI-6-A]|uniref:hypothetical protein n=1 Tax=Kribbella sp. ALI-6-A TaxID=1933817 RepID=UPI0011799F9C|nr:hypothetical protein [Kribbella sp. ALI-6-A]